MEAFDTILTGSTLVAFLATVALAFFVPQLRGKGRSKQKSTAGITPVMPDKTPVLPVEHDDPDWLECVTVSRHVADLMIADEWVEIADKILDWEATLSSTPGGARYHDLAIDTCLSGLQSLLDDAPVENLSDLEAAEVEVGHFMDSHRQLPENHILAVLAARAQIALADVYGSDDWSEPTRRDALRRRAKHYIAAGDILEAFDPVAYMSPLLAEATYLHATGTPGGEARLRELFDDWINLDPSHSRIYETHVSAMVSTDQITAEDVLSEAETAMQRTENTLGFGGYALFFMPLLSEYDSARDLLDAELYAAALTDLASNSATQAEINHAAAALLTEIDASDEGTAETLRDTLYLMVRQHLEVIHPRIWPISVEEVQELASHAVHVLPDLDLVESFAPDRVAA